MLLLLRRRDFSWTNCADYLLFPPLMPFCPSLPWLCYRKLILWTASPKSRQSWWG